MRQVGMLARSNRSSIHESHRRYRTKSVILLARGLGAMLILADLHQQFETLNPKVKYKYASHVRRRRRSLELTTVVAGPLD